jgi:predicted aminopeptidase
MSLYEGRLPEFRALLESCDGDIECFYEEARRLASR